MVIAWRSCLGYFLKVSPKVLCRQVMAITSKSSHSVCQTGCDMWMGQINELEVDWEEKEVIIK